ncbi:hypothetical protein M0R45_007773 [Rubus argutus]
MNVQETHSSQEFPFKTYNSSDQFMVVQDRRFQKNNFPRNETLLESTADSHVTLESPWICHFTAAGKSCNVAYPNLREHIVSSNKGTRVRRKQTLKEMRVTARSSEHNPACHQGSAGSTTEVSGQNFVDEEHRGKLSCEFIPKRFKRASADASSNDQLVPLRNFDTNEVSMVHNAVPEGDEQGHHQLLSEHPESFVCAKTIFTVS